MKIGDVVFHRDARWKVLSHSTSFRTCVLMRFNGEKIEVPDDLDKTQELKVLFNPADAWPFVAVSGRPKSGPLVSVLRNAAALAPLTDWVPSDFVRPGGAVFFNPELRLRQGEVLVGVHQDGARIRIAITGAFGTVRNRLRRRDNPVKVKGPRTSHEQLLSGEDIFDED